MKCYQTGCKNEVTLLITKTFDATQMHSCSEHAPGNKAHLTSVPDQTDMHYLFQPVGQFKVGDMVLCKHLAFRALIESYNEKEKYYCLLLNNGKKFYAYKENLYYSTHKQL